MKPNLLPQTGSGCPSQSIQLRAQQRQAAARLGLRLVKPLTSAVEESEEARTTTRLQKRGLNRLAMRIARLNYSFQLANRDRVIVLRENDFVLLKPSTGEAIRNIGSLNAADGKPFLSLDSSDVNFGEREARGVAHKMIEAGDYGVRLKVGAEEVADATKFVVSIDENGGFEKISCFNAKGEEVLFIHMKGLSEAALAQVSIGKTHEN